MHNVQHAINQAKEILQRKEANQEVQTTLKQAAQVIEETMNQQGQTYATMLRDVRNSLENAIHACNQPNNHPATENAITEAFRACELAEQALKGL